MMVCKCDRCGKMVETEWTHWDFTPDRPKYNLMDYCRNLDLCDECLKSVVSAIDNCLEENN